MLFFTGVIIFIALLNTIVYYLRQHLEEKDYGERTISSTALLPDNGCRRFSLTEIQFATQNFNEAFVIGNGGFGKVYKGIIDSGASTVAIKRLDIGSSQGAPEFWTEIEMLSKFRHSHLVSLIGYCNDQNEMIIVYEYMPSGSLEDNLYKIGRSNGQNRRSLPWIQRLKICLGAARGLDYLHTGTSTEHRVIHRDVKSSNILLDENMEAKISDFGLSKIGPINQPCTDVCTHVKGTFGYLDPQYFLTHRLTKKSDVYAFGVVLFEVLCGRPAVDSRLDEEQWGLAGWAKQCVKEGKISQFVDPSLNGSILSNCLDEFSIIACQCLHNSSKRRPTMGEVVTKLEFALAMQEMPDTSLLEDEIIRPFGTYDNKEITNASTEQGISNPAPGRGTSTEQEVVNARNTGSNFGQFDSFWRLGGPSLAYSYARPAKKRTFVKRLRAFFSLKYPSTTEMPDTSLLEDEINRPLGTFENQEIADSTTDQWISNTAPGRDTFTEQEVVNVPNTGSNFGEIDSFWRQGGLSLVMSHARNDRKRTKRVRAFFSSKFRSTTETESLDGLESFKFDFGTVRTATDNFAHANKLGEGGFGPVFKGRLQNGQEVAIKMLSITSSQGESEFRNEVMLLRKVHHKNLIRLLGFCVKGNQKLLIYEFAQNGSLDRFLFGAVNYPYLNWDHRYKIIRGVARGIHYLHEESPFRIFHRNIKPSNILLGAEFDPKISDFGFANLLNQRVSECSTDKIVGTCGYLAPEYVVNGKFSVKTDVFSFGILLLEVIRGQKMMTYSFVGDNSDNNIENAWRNWREGTPLNFADLTLRADLNDGADVVKCIQIGLLCIQDKAVERPTMGSVLLMLSSSSTSLPEPSEPAFSIRCSNNIYQEESISDGETDMWNHYSGSEDSMTDLYPR